MMYRRGGRGREGNDVQEGEGGKGKGGRREGEGGKGKGRVREREGREGGRERLIRYGPSCLIPGCREGVCGIVI